MLPEGQVLFTRQRHEAKRAGLHYDYRVVVGDKAYSWATRKELPEMNQAIIFHEQPVHDRKYALSKKVVIPDGNYGAGVTTLDMVHKAHVKTYADNPNKFVLTTKKSRFLLLKLNEEKYGKKAWLFRHLPKKKAIPVTTPTKQAVLTKIASYVYPEIPKSEFDLAFDG